MTTDEPLAYPLDWPASVPRREQPPERNYRFGKGTHRSLTTTFAAFEVTRELERMRVDAGTVVISTNWRVRLDGGIIAKQRSPEDPAAAVYWRKRGEPYCLSCDAWDQTAHNLHAIALHLEALRGLDRWGCGTSEQAFAGYKALPPARDRLDWEFYFGLEREFATVEEIQAAFRESSKTAHPDAGGTAEEFDRLVKMRAAALDALGS